MDLSKALAGGGAVLVVLAFIIGSLFGEGAKPVERANDAAEEVGLSPTEPAHPYCHDGWDAKVGKDNDTVFYNCLRGGWTVIVDTQDGTFLRAEKDKQFTENAAEVPGW